MPFEIPLKKPVAREKEDNRKWADELIRRFPEFQREETAPAVYREIAESVAPDIGLTADEYVARGIGEWIRFERDDLFVDVHFYDDIATVDLPNFPNRGAQHALKDATPIIDALVALGFELLDPRTYESLSGPREEALIAAYEDREVAVDHVARLVHREHK